MSARYSKESPFTGILHTMEFDLYDQQEFELRMLAYQSGKGLIQDIFPELSDDAREFLKTGITPLEWLKYME